MPLNITEVLAAYGALLSTFVFVWSVLSTRRRLRVLVMYGTDMVNGEHKTGVSVIIQNPSSSTVHVSAISILYPWKKTNTLQVIAKSIRYRRWFSTYGWVYCQPNLYNIADGCPISIGPGHAHRFLIPLDAVENIVNKAHSRKLLIIAQDQLSNNTNSKPFHLI